MGKAKDCQADENENCSSTGREAEMTVLCKACVSFHFREMNDLENNVITTIALRERKLS